MKTAKLFCSMLLLASAAVAQEQVGPLVKPQPQPTRIDGTRIADGLPEAIASARRYAVQQVDPGDVAEKTGATYSIGDTRTFEVLKNLSTDPIWESRPFTLKAESTPTDPVKVHIWVEDSEYSSGRVTDDLVAQLRSALINSTPAGSIDPAKGILANNNAIFGNPPDVDADGFVDVVLYDVVEGTTDCCVLGYVTSANLTARNRKDILYLDTRPGDNPLNLNGVLQTASHEYQHLIHYAYDLQEQTFINEGLSEYSEIMNGYSGRSITYLDLPDQHPVPLLRWSPNSQWENVLRDYERAGLFTAYLANRFGAAVAGAVTRTNAHRGTAAYSKVLSDNGLPALAQVIRDFHTANFINNRTLDDRYGYTSSQYTSVRAQSSLSFDARLTTSTPAGSIRIDPGGVEYLTWNHVTDLSITLSARDALNPERFHPRVVKVAENGSITVEDINLGATAFPGAFDRVTVVVPHLYPDLSFNVLNYSATWSAAQQYTLESTTYDDGSIGEFFGLGANTEVGTKFDRPEGGILSKVRLPLYHYSQFGNEDAPPPSTARDFQLIVRNLDESGLPGNAVLSLDLADTRSYAAVPLNAVMTFLDVDLDAYQEELQALGDVFYVGFKDIGVDENFIIIATTQAEPSVTSYGRPGNWRDLWSLSLSGTSLNGHLVPVRAEFLVPTGGTPSEDAPLATRLELQPNYPNPFQVSTNIRYQLPAAGEVRLSAWDLLGRKVATLVDGLQEAGPHTLTFDSAALASGTYFLVLEAANERIVHKMTVVR